MTEKNERAGLGKVIYSVDDEQAPPRTSEEKVDDADVREASEESFPASDAPGYAGRSSTESD